MIEYNNNSILLGYYIWIHVMPIYITFLVLILIIWPLCYRLIKIMYFYFFMLPVSNLYGDALKPKKKKKYPASSSNPSQPTLTPSWASTVGFGLYSLHMMIVKWPFSRCTLCPTLTKCHSIFFCVARASLYHVFYLFISGDLWMHFHQ